MIMKQRGKMLKDSALQANMKRIRDLTETVTPVASFVEKSLDGVEVTLDTGGCKIFKKDHELCTSMFCVFEANTIFPNHVHSEHEYIIVLDGYIDIGFGDGLVRFNQFDTVHIQPKQQHLIIIEQKTTVLAITAPPSEDY